MAKLIENPWFKLLIPLILAAVVGIAGLIFELRMQLTLIDKELEDIKEDQRRIVDFVTKHMEFKPGDFGI